MAKNGPDNGLIACWERGREKRAESPDLAADAELGKLVLLPWRGGVEKAVKSKQKFGSLNYLAMWQGLRGEDLDIDPNTATVITCIATGVSVTFVRNSSLVSEE
jgi:hypothetical protein